MASVRKQGGECPRHDIDAQEAAVKRAQADEASPGAQVTQSRASLMAIETDMRKAVIRSPINGTVLDRQIDPGQTVAASFQTPTLTLAEDLTR
jgi:HlyD family secretion protein